MGHRRNKNKRSGAQPSFNERNAAGFRACDDPIAGAAIARRLKAFRTIGTRIASLTGSTVVIGTGKLMSKIVMDQIQACGRGPAMRLLSTEAGPLEQTRTRRPIVLHSTVGVQEHIGIQQLQLRTKG